MPAQILDVDTLKNYIEGVMQRAEHHAQSVASVALTLAGAIIWKKDPEPIEVFSYDGVMKNVLWVRIRGQRYAFSYDHKTGQIEMRQGSTQGSVMHRFDDTVSADVVRTIFAAL